MQSDTLIYLNLLKIIYMYDKQNNTPFVLWHLDVLSQASWARRSEASTRSHISDRASLISSVPGGPDNDERLTPQQYGVLGKSNKIYY